MLRRTQAICTHKNLWENEKIKILVYSSLLNREIDEKRDTESLQKTQRGHKAKWREKKVWTKMSSILLR